MENRSAVVKELFELRVLLNKSNQLANQKTEIDFDIKNNDFIAFIPAKTKQSCILLAKKSLKNEKWHISEAPYCYFLRKAVAEELNRIQNELITTHKNPLIIKGILLFRVKEKLRSLLLEKLD